MPVALSVPHFFVALMLTVVSTTVFAEYKQPSVSKENESLVIYRTGCDRAQGALIEMEKRKGQREFSDFYSLDSLEYAESKSGSKGLSAEETTRCSAVFAKAKSMLAAEAAAEDAKNKKMEEAAHIAYQNSPEYKKAQSMGYEGTAGIAYLTLTEDMYGEEKMKKILYDVDTMCGKDFRAVQYSAPYVIYAREGCGTDKKVAILGTKNVSSGDYFDPDAVFEYVGWRKILETDGFTVEIRTLKQL
ncbi:hypothetical protein K5D33_05950 [Pseudomonas cichorii]|nr:hypothetical protein [Pseudomonas cichorii]MBX8534262.1 hypothetical protein [Pseudomonas cichorii]